MAPRRNSVSRLGYALVASGLAVWLVTAGLGLGVHPVTEFSIAGVAIGVVMIAAGPLLRAAGRRRTRPSYYIACSRCGWQGDPDIWREYEGCPECDSQEGRRTFVH
ncbi:MAG: hypothetical protein HYX74_06700 [Acidobacteria bacterium]|nr:hypothetical protein [Acidobacteriota bacterium]